MKSKEWKTLKGNMVKKKKKDYKNTLKIIHFNAQIPQATRTVYNKIQAIARKFILAHFQNLPEPRPKLHNSDSPPEQSCL